MKTTADLEKDILDITMKMDKKFPELSKYRNEIPIADAETDEEVNTKNLKEYYDSLVELLAEYSKTHVAVKEGARED